MPMMKGLHIMGPGKFEIINQPVPEIEAHQILVEIQVVSTCPRWDINMMAGKDMFDYSRSPDYPLSIGFPGHEAAGIVREVGTAVKNLKVGDRVAALEPPKEGGAYAQYAVYEEYELIQLPESISFEQAVSFELLKCVMIGMLQFGDIRGKSFLVAGLGPAGILAMQLAHIWGASQVVGIDLSDKRIDYVGSLQIGEVCLVDELGKRQFDLGYDCVGAASSVQNVLNHTEQQVVIFGVLRGTVQYGDQLWMKGTKLESYRYRPFNSHDRMLLLDAVMNRGLNTTCIQTHHSSFRDYDRVVELLSKQEAIKVYFYPTWDMD